MADYERDNRKNNNYTKCGEIGYICKEFVKCVDKSGIKRNNIDCEYLAPITASQ